MQFVFIAKPQQRVWPVKSMARRAILFGHRQSENAWLIVLENSEAALSLSADTVQGTVGRKCNFVSACGATSPTGRRIDYC